MATQPLVLGQWLSAGQHVDLIGAWKSDMREADDEVMRRGRVFVDSRATTIGHIGEIDLPLASGALTKNRILGDFYDVAAGVWTRDENDITVFKNGGGAHLDLMSARYILTA